MVRGRSVVAVIAAGVAVLLVAAFFRLSPLAPGPALPAGATRLAMATDPAQLLPAMGCQTALLLPVRVATGQNDLILVSVQTGQPTRVVWPAGFAAWRSGGQAQVVAHDGSVFAREGDVLSGVGGGVGVDDAFHICILGR